MVGRGGHVCGTSRHHVLVILIVYIASVLVYCITIRLGPGYRLVLVLAKDTNTRQYTNNCTNKSNRQHTGGSRISLKGGGGAQENNSNVLLRFVITIILSLS